jgi:hypothetical protein
MAEHSGYGPERAIQPSDLDVVARSLTGKLSELGILKAGVKEPHVLVQSALEVLVKELGAEVYDLAWKDGNTINRHDESDLGFYGAPGKPVQKRCRRLVLTVVPNRWSPRRS